MVELDRKTNNLLTINRRLVIIQRYWKLGVALLTVSVVGICLLLYPDSVDWMIYKPLRFVTVVTGLLAACWLLSYVVRWFVMRRLTRLREQMQPPSAKEAPKKKTRRGSTRMLSLWQRFEAKRRLLMLRKASDYCFLGNHDSYVRIQRLVDGEEVLYKLTGDVIPIPVTSPLKDSPDERMLVIENGRNDRGRAWVRASLVATDPRRQDAMDAQRVLLMPDEPVALAYGTLNTLPNGEEKSYDAFLYVITWVGGVV